MKRQFNYTGRSKIPRSQIAIKLRGESGVRAFDASVDLDSIEAPDTAEVYVEAYYKRTYMRFPFGTVRDVRPPADRRLTDLERGSQLYFRVKVVDPGEEHGRLLAVADGIRVATDEDQARTDQLCILPVNFKEDMGELPFRLTMDSADGPVIEVNTRIPNAREYVARDPVFRAFVYPSVVRDVLRSILDSDLEPDGESSDGSWQQSWLRFAIELCQTIPPSSDDQDAVEAWLDELMESVADRLRLQTILTDALRGTDDSALVE